MGQRTLKLLTLERFAAAILLHDDQFAKLDALKGGETAAASRAMAAAADRRIILAGAAVFDLRVVMSAKWATHEK
jgi:hypothetical protein